MTILREARTKLGLPVMKLVRFKGMPILEQLFVEEKLLRTSSDNWCIVNDGTNPPAIVMGMSGKASELVQLGSVLRDGVPVIRRFTGGGTVIVDNGTVFFTLICNKDALPTVQPYPRPIMSWSGLLYNEVFRAIADFQLCENGKFGCVCALISRSKSEKNFSADYVFGDYKFGGNAQSITKNRWLHHTSFLWDYELSNMAYLKQPARAPKYRMERDHAEFVCKMKEYLSRSIFIEKTLKTLESHFSVQSMELDSIVAPDEAGFIHSTKLLTKQELEDACSSPLKSIAQGC